MFPEFSQGTFLWQWLHSWAGLNGMALALIVATLAIVLTKWSPSTAGFKMLITAGAAASLPLGLTRMGINIPVDNDLAIAVRT